jgi:hypothetical protein
MHPFTPVKAISLLLLLVFLLLPSGLSVRAASHQITVAAGDWDRLDSVVSFALPAGLSRSCHLEDSQGNLVPIQIADTGRRAWFIEKELKKGATKTYQLIQTGLKAGSEQGVQVARESSRYTCSVGGKAVFSYQAEPSELPRANIKPAFKRGGYLHPVLTPSGRLITDDYPPNHLHHHGIWFSWAHTEFEGREPDFWNMGDTKGTTEFVSLDKTWNGPVHGGIQSRHRYVDLTTSERKIAVNETWLVTLYNVGAGLRRYWMFDLVSTQSCATASPLKLPEYRYGGVGFRGRWDWNGKDNTFFLTSEGETNRDRGNGTPARWCHLSGNADGAQAGVAILCHPDNFRAPQPTRLHPTEPFFCFAPQAAGDMEIVSGKPYVSRYRFIVADGPPDQAELNRLWNDYAHPPAVKID